MQLASAEAPFHSLYSKIQLLVRQKPDRPFFYFLKTVKATRTDYKFSSAFHGALFNSNFRWNESWERHKRGCLMLSIAAGDCVVVGGSIGDWPNIIGYRSSIDCAEGHGSDRVCCQFRATRSSVVPCCHAHQLYSYLYETPIYSQH